MSFEVQGSINKAMVYAESVDDATMAQIIGMCNLPSLGKGNRIAIMPDCHAGAGCTIGTTFHIQKAVIPNMVGVDIGCGVLAVELQGSFSVQDIDKIIHNKVPAGFDVREYGYYPDHMYGFLDNLRCKEHVNLARARLSIGTLGGGEVDCHRAA